MAVYDDLEIPGGPNPMPKPGPQGPQLPPPPPQAPLPPGPPGSELLVNRLNNVSRPNAPAEDAPLPAPPPPRPRLSNVPLAEPAPLELPGGMTGRSSGFFESLGGRGVMGNPMGMGSPLSTGMMDDPRRRLPDDETLRGLILGG